MDERLVQFDEKMQKTMNNLSEEFGSIRAGRANPHVLDKLRVDYYGTPTPIQQVANVNVPEPRMIQIQPWEASMVKEIEKVIMTSDLGINPTNDGKTIRLLFPELTEERRKDLAKDVKKKGESAKVAIRNIRRDANDSFKKLAVVDLTASIMCMENKMPMYVFGLNEENSIVNAVNGAFRGTKVTVD